MTPAPNRSTAAGSAYLDLRKLAAVTNRPTDELHQLFGLEGFLDRLTRSDHVESFVLKGGVLLAAYAARRPTRDIDFAATQMPDELDAVADLVNQILAVDVDDGLVFDRSATAAEPIREHDSYPSIRVKIVGELATARIRFHVDINSGDPLWPEPVSIELPRLLDAPAIRVRGYSVELVLAEKIVTALQRGTANTRWRDFVDISVLARTAVDQTVLAESIKRVAAHRQTQIQSLDEALDGYAEVAQTRWAAWRRKQQLDDTPASFAELLASVVEFTDPILSLARDA